MRRALRSWAAGAATTHPQLLAVALFGSYARGDWGVGSDADVILLVAGAHASFLERPRDWDLSSLPVAADVLVYEPAEWKELTARDDRFARVLRTEATWVWRREADEG